MFYNDRPMLSRRPALWLRLLPLALVIPGCDGGRAAVSPTAVPAPAAGITLTCALGSTDCSSVMQGQTLRFTARPGDSASSIRSAVLTYGDGSPALDLGAFTAPATVSHEYTRLGSFTARLEATTAGGETRSAAVSIRVDTLVTASLAVTNLDPRVFFTYPSPGYKAVEMRAVLADGRVVTASAAVIVGREHEG